jgi:malonyl-CoA O-methyltransferase
MTEDYVLDRAEVRRAFDRAAASYDAHAVLQCEICDRLLERLDFMKLDPQQVLDVGAGTGYGLQQLRTRYAAANLIGLDLSTTMLMRARSKLPATRWLDRMSSRLISKPAASTDFICADMERLPLKSHSVDLLWSSLALQWANDLEATLRDFYRTLAPNGLLMFATFGPDTLKELRSAFAHIDDAPHVNRFADLHDIGDMLVNAGFASPVMEMEMLTLTYADLKSLMVDLKGIGAHNAATVRRRGLLGKSAWKILEQQYEGNRVDGRLPATYEVIYGHAWVGDKTRLEDGRKVIQFKIAERQTGQRRS